MTHFWDSMWTTESTSLLMQSHLNPIHKWDLALDGPIGRFIIPMSASRA